MFPESVAPLLGATKDTVGAAAALNGKPANAAETARLQEAIRRFMLSLSSFLLVGGLLGSVRAKPVPALNYP
jgi:hypothetical protein